MAHQINLYSPILLAPRRYFSALAMAQSLAVLAAGLAALAGWTLASTTRLQGELASSTRFHGDERQRLQAALDAGGRSLPADSAALEQELARERATLAERQQRLDALKRGLVQDDRTPSALLRLLARTLPAPMWLAGVHYADGRLEINGYTQQPEALRPWLTTLSQQPLAAGQPLALLRVERVGGSGGSGAATTPPAWSFRIGPAGSDAGSGGRR